MSKIINNQLVFATSNPNKIKEIRTLIQGDYQFLSLEEIGCLEEIPETSDTIEGNALQKARYVFEKFGKNCFAEDTGLEVEALNGEPGVYSARYAGEERDANANMDLLLERLSAFNNRAARFKTVIALILDQKEFLFEGIIEGRILKDKIGKKGFGYDPVFVPENENKSFAQMDLAEKSQMSHRGRAFRKLKNYLETM